MVHAAASRAAHQAGRAGAAVNVAALLHAALPARARVLARRRLDAAVRRRRAFQGPAQVSTVSVTSSRLRSTVVVSPGQKARVTSTVAPGLGTKVMMRSVLRHRTVRPQPEE